MSRLFVTGGSGFVGSRLLPVLADRGHSVAALVRRSSGVAAPVRPVTGDLLQPATYLQALRDSEVVVHLAALTGRGSGAEHSRVNAEGTGVLVEACREAGVRRIVFVSSIAAGFPDRTSYPYAEAKVRAEKSIKRSGLAFTIVRPTMIFGPGSPVLDGLARLSLLPVVPVFGDGRTLVQPIHVDDVVRALVQAIEDDGFQNGTFDVGGPEVLSIQELLLRIRTARRRAAGRRIHVPLGLMLPPLRAAEAAGLTAVLPITAGQLSTFRFAGTAADNPLQQRILSGARSLTAMLDEPSDRPHAGLEAECLVFARHLIGLAPAFYIRQKYVTAHDALPGLEATDRFEAALLAFASLHPACTALADAYAGVFLQGSVLRRKLVLLLALLETAAPSASIIDRRVGGGPATVTLRLLLRGALAAGRLLAATLLLTPARLLLAGRPR